MGDAALYGAAHRRARERWAPSVATGRVECRRSRQDPSTCLEDDPLIGPGEPWQLGHPDEDCPLPTAPEHRHCNEAVPRRIAAAKARAPVRKPPGWL
jgi:hypothetical protein